MPPQNFNQIVSEPRKIDTKFILLIILGFILIGINLCFLYKAHFKKEIIDQNLLINSKATATDEFVDWKVHVDRENGFQISYPPNLILGTSTSNSKDVDKYNLVSISGNSVGSQGDHMSFLIYKFLNPNNLGSKEWWKKQKERKDLMISYEDTGIETQISGKNAFQTISGYESPDSVVYFVSNDGYLYQILYGLPWQSTDKLAENILSTFKFISTSTPITTKLKVCPDEWIQNNIPTVGESNEERQYYILNGERKEIAEFDASWVGQNCNLEKQIVY